MVFIGNLEKEWYDHPASEKYAYDLDQVWSERQGDHLPHMIWMKCPCCQKKSRPFAEHKNTAQYHGTTYPWVGCEYQNIVKHYTAECWYCHKRYAFSLLFQQ